MSGPASPTPQDLENAERALGGVVFPADYRRWLLSHNGLEQWFGKVFLMLFSLDDVLAVTDAAEAHGRLPGYVPIGSDGGSEYFALDFRKTQPPVVMINAVCSGWHEGLLQATSFGEFMAQREAGEDFRWNEPYN